MATKEHGVTSVDEHEGHPGETLVTRDHDVIRSWAEKRGAQPATVERFFRLRYPDREDG